MRITKFRYIVLLVAITAVILVQIFSILTNEQNVIDDYIYKIESDTLKLINVSERNKQKIANLLYEMLITDEIEFLMARAFYGDETTRNILRQELMNLLKEDYSYITTTGIEQFQFHFPDATSFLRMHQTDVHGDKLDKVRVTVNQVIKNKEPVSGYEEGRFFGGYRYVYPIFSGGKYVGSVEFSYKYKNVVNPVNQSFGTVNYLIINESEIDVKTHKVAEIDYLLDPLTNIGYIRSAELSRNIREELQAKEGLFQELTNLIVMSLSDGLKESKIEYVYDRDQVIWAHIVPLEDVTSKIIGYMVFYKNDSNFSRLLNNHNESFRNSVLLTVISIILLIIIFSSYNQVHKKAIYDSLTGLYTRHAYTGLLSKDISNGVCMMMDIDDFKNINDTYGHFIGDEILKALSNLVMHQIRDKDCAIRWGGEEFLILLKDISMTTGITRAEELVEKIRNMNVSGINLTVSIGVAELGENQEESFNKADQALYKAKENGKDQIYVFGEKSYS